MIPDSVINVNAKRIIAIYLRNGTHVAVFPGSAQLVRQGATSHLVFRKPNVFPSGPTEHDCILDVDEIVYVVLGA